MEDKRYDLIAIGGGSAGLVATVTAARIGARVALIERDRVGGDCLWTGCVPSKTLLASAARAQAFRGAAKYGIGAAEPEIDFPAVMERVRAAIEATGRRDTPEHLREVEGVEVIEAEARFVAPGVIEAAGRRLRFRAAVIATGSRPTIPPIPGLEQVDPLTNETIFELEELSARLLVLGGGAIGCELGQAFARLGSEVDLLEGEERLLPQEEPFAGEMLARTFAEEGIEVRTGTKLETVEQGETPGSGIAHTDDGSAIPFDRILVATGRVPVTEGLGLEAVGVETDERGAVVVDERLRTTGDRIFAAGDVTGGLQFTHVAGYHGLLAMANGLFRARQKAERDWVPWVTFTDPEVAHVGLTEAQARERHGADSTEVFDFDHDELDRALTAGTGGASKLVAGKRGKLVGATIVGEAAGESISESARLIREGRKVADLSQMIHAYPTFTEGPARAADKYWARRAFTPRTRRLMKPVLALLRLVDRPRG